MPSVAVPYPLLFQRVDSGGNRLTAFCDHADLVGGIMRFCYKAGRVVFVYGNPSGNYIVFLSCAHHAERTGMAEIAKIGGIG